MRPRVSYRHQCFHPWRFANEEIRCLGTEGSVSGRRRTLVPIQDVGEAMFDSYRAKFRERVNRFSDAWYLCVLADTRCRPEQWESEFRFATAFVPSRPWNSVIRASANDRDFWKEELKDKVVDVRNVQNDRGGVRARSKSEDDKVGPTHRRHRTTATRSQICFTFNRALDGCVRVLFGA